MMSHHQFHALGMRIQDLNVSAQILVPCPRIKLRVSYGKILCVTHNNLAVLKQAKKRKESSTNQQVASTISHCACVTHKFFFFWVHPWVHTERDSSTFASFSIIQCVSHPMVMDLPYSAFYSFVLLRTLVSLVQFELSFISELVIIMGAHPIVIDLPHYVFSLKIKRIMRALELTNQCGAGNQNHIFLSVRLRDFFFRLQTAQMRHTRLSVC